MNKTRRNEISALITDLESAKERAESIMSDEQDAFDNMPESFQDGERGEIAQEAINNLEYAIDGFDELISNLEAAAE